MDVQDHGRVNKKQKTAQSEDSLPPSAPSQTTIKKANEVFEFMRSKRLSIADFVSAIPYVAGNGRRQEVVVKGLFENEDVSEDLLLRKNYDVDLKPLSKIIGTRLSQELMKLQSTGIFGKYKLPSDKESSTQTKNELLANSSKILDLELDSVDIIDKEAPMLSNLFKRLLSKEFEHEESSETSTLESTDSQGNIRNRLILILSVLCYTRNKKKSTNIPVLFGLYLNSLGLTTKRGLQIFNKFGITVNPRTVNDLLNDLSHLERVPNHPLRSNDTEGINNGNEITAQQKIGDETDSLILPYTQNIISSTNDIYRTPSSHVSMKISDAKFNQLFDQYTQNTSVPDQVDPKLPGASMNQDR